MSEAKDTLLRLIALLRLIPREPQFIATTTLQEKLKDRGFSVDLRSIQRDLHRLSVPFSLLCDESERPYRWSFSRSAPVDLSAMDTPTALAFYLAESHLHVLLPQSVLDQLAPQFLKARNYLDGLGKNGLAHWAKRVRALPNGKALLPAEVRQGVWSTVSAGLLEGKQLQVEYLSRSKAEIKRFRIHPAGLVSRHSVSYLIGTSDGYLDLRHFALHRFRSVELINVRAREHDDFDLDRYIASGAFAMRQIPEQVELIADIHPQIAWLLSETPLDREQTLQPLPGTDWCRLRAIVPLDKETLWWVFGLNDHIRVHEPDIWAKQIKITLDRMRDMYAVAGDTL